MSARLAVNPLAIPVAFAQGAWVRARTTRLPPATGPETGTAPPGPGMAGGTPGTALRLAVLGESTAAGCGVATHDEGFPGSFARALADRRHRPVAWRVVGQDGATARRLRHRLVPRLLESEPERFDVVALLAGVNDVLSRRTPDAWGGDLAAVLDALTARSDLVIVAGIPPLASFPALPRTLGHYLGGRAAALDEVSRRLCDERSGTTWIGGFDLPPGEEFFAVDGMHPSRAGYRLWARALAERLPG